MLLTKAWNIFKTSLLKALQKIINSFWPPTTKIQLQITVPINDILGTYLSLSLFVNLVQLPQLLQNSLHFLHKL